MTLVNAHTHLELSGLSHLRPPAPADLGPWLYEVARAVDGLSPEARTRDTERGIEQLRAAGITQVCDVTSTGASIEPLRRSGLGGVVYLEIRGEARQRARAELNRARCAIDVAREKQGGSPLRVGLALHSPYLCHPELIVQASRWCAEEGVPWTIHLAESVREPLGIRHLRSVAAVDEFPIPTMVTRLLAAGLSRLRSLQGPVEYLDRLGALEARPLLTHCIHLSDAEIRRVAESGCHVVHCPHSNHRLSCGRMPLERFLAAGVPVHLGTDSLASSPSLDIREEIRFASELHRGRVEPAAIEKLGSTPLPD